MMDILEIDAGNTSVKWRLCNAGRIVDRGSIATNQFSRELLVSAIKEAPHRVRLSSVAAKQVVEAVKQASKIWQSTVFDAITKRHQAGVTCAYVEPETMGVDRWLAMLATFDQFKQACVVVDAGSAVTVDLVSSDGEHLGGYIVPGLQLVRSLLLEGTSQVNADNSFAVSTEPGINTSQAVNQGAFLMLKGLVENAAKTLQCHGGFAPKIIVTGGDAPVLIEALAVDIEHCPDLVLDGLSLAAEGQEG